MDNTAKNVLPGDVDLNGETGIADLVKLQNHILRRSVLTSGQAAAADINFDGVIDIFDVVELRKILSN